MFFACVLFVIVSTRASALQTTLRVNSEGFQANVLNADALADKEERDVHKLEFRDLISKTFRTRNEEATRSFPTLEEGVSVIVPGFGDYRRADVVKSNIQWLQQQDIDFDCKIYVYRDEGEFPLNSSDFAPCQLVRHHGMWMDHLLAFPMNETRKKYIMHLLDGTRLGPEVQLPRMLKVMAANDLVHSAPSFCGDDNGCKPFMYNMDDTGVGRFVDMIELQINIFTRDHFACMQDVIHEENKLGWGVAEVLPSVCKGMQGILDEMVARKEFHGSYNTSEAERQRFEYLATFPDIVIPTGLSLGLLNKPAEENPKALYFEKFDGLYCHDYYYRGMEWFTDTESGAKALCEADSDCAGVAQWNCGSNSWTLCGYSGSSFTEDLGNGKCAYRKVTASTRDWSDKMSMVVSGGDIKGTCFSRVGYPARIDRCKAICDKITGCKAFSYAKVGSWSGMCKFKNATQLSADATFDTYVVKAPR